MGGIAQFDFNSKELQLDLLKTLFKKPKHKWDKDEIYEDWGNDEISKNNLQTYSAGYQINKYIYAETQIKDFLLLGRKYAQINPKYI